MKPAMLLIPLLALAAANAQAQQVSPPATPAAAGGYTGPGVAAISIAQAQQSRDEAQVRVRGKISQHLGGERYLLTDASGTIQADIDADVWQGQSIDAKDLVEIDGEIDKDWNSVELDVNRLRKL